MKIGDLSLVPVAEIDFSLFKALRYKVLSEHAQFQELPFALEEEEDCDYRALFWKPGLSKITWNNHRVGFFGLRPTPTGLLLDRFYLATAVRGLGIGTRVLERVLSHPSIQGHRILLDVLKKNPARRLYERHGFLLVSAGSHLVEYARPPRPAPNLFAKAVGFPFVF